MQAHASESGLSVDEVYAHGRGEEERGRIQRARVCEAEDWSSRAAAARARAAAGGRRRRGPIACRVPDVEAPRLAQGGGPRWPGTTDWGCYSAGMRCSALWSTPIACQGMSLSCRARPLHLGGSGRCKQRGLGLGCPGDPLGEERGRGIVGIGLSSIVKWGFTPLNH